MLTLICPVCSAPAVAVNLGEQGPPSHSAYHVCWNVTTSGWGLHDSSRPSASRDRLHIEVALDDLVAPR
jgi:hypothetical protein